MRLLLFISAMLVTLSSGNIKKSAINLNGTWKPVKQEFGGTELPAALKHNGLLLVTALILLLLKVLTKEL
jgi:hypothetical protein